MVLESVSYRYPGSNRDALSNVSVGFKGGSSTAIVGPNGAGKSTLVRLMNGLLRPSKGRVLLDGADTSKKSVAELARRVGVVFQNPDHQIFAGSVREEVAFALKNFGFPVDEIKYRVDNALQRLGLSKYADSSPFTLSSGEKKRLTIASVIAYEPDILVFDEPTVGQDYRNKTIIGGILKEFENSGRCIVSVTHDVDFALNFHDRVVVLSNGVIKADLNTSEFGLDAFMMHDTNLVPTEAIFIREIMKLVEFRGVYEPGALAEHIARWVCK
ncbi:MAG: ABC transporter ATP-binding protein [Thermoprotei archaeon]